MILVGLFCICLLSRVDICSLYRGILYVWASGLFSFYKDFLISRFFPIHFTVTLVGLKTIVRYIEDFVVSKFVKSRFHCALSCMASETSGILVAWFFWLILNLTECNFQGRGICLMVWAHPLTFTLLPFFWSEIAINFFTKQPNSHTINYLEDTLFTYIEVAEFYLPYT